MMHSHNLKMDINILKQIKIQKETTQMKKGIHPTNYREVLFYDASVQQGWVIRSCAATTKTMKWTDGKEYPLYTLDTSSASHPVYTGKRREVNSEGRASRFSDKFKGMASLVAKK